MGLLQRPVQLLVLHPEPLQALIRRELLRPQSLASASREEGTGRRAGVGTVGGWGDGGQSPAQHLLEVALQGLEGHGAEPDLVQNAFLVGLPRGPRLRTNSGVRGINGGAFTALNRFPPDASSPSTRPGLVAVVGLQWESWGAIICF